MSNAISVPGVQVNNDPIAIVPNSMKIVPGDGEMKARSASVGDDSVEIIYTEDAESKIGECKFEMFPTDENITKIREWKSKKGTNFIAFSQKDGKSYSMATACLMNNTEIELSADGKISLEWQGQPWSNS